MKLPNRFVIAFALLFFPAALAVGLPLAEVGMHLAAGAAMLAVSFMLFIPGWIGGGDAKFFAAVALWLGWGPLLEYALLSGILGGFLTLALVSMRAVPLPAFLVKQEWAYRLHHPDTGVPYGIAMAFAGLLVFPESSWGAAIGL